MDFFWGALIFLAIPCAVSSWLACSSSSWPALRPRAPDTTIKKGSPREGYFCVLGCGGWGVGARGEGRRFFLRFLVPLFLACAFFFFSVRASPPARKGRSFLFSCELWVYPAWRPPSAVPCPLGQKCLEHLSSARAHRGADRQPPSWRCCCSWLLLGVSAKAPCLFLVLRARGASPLFGQSLMSALFVGCCAFVLEFLRLCICARWR